MKDLKHNFFTKVSNCVWKRFNKIWLKVGLAMFYTL